MKTVSQQIYKAIEDAQSVLITFNRTWPGDAVASALALRLWLITLGKKVEVVAEKPSVISPYSFLPGFSHIKPELDNLRKFIISLDISNAEVGQIEYQVEKNKLDFIISPKNGIFTNDDISSRSKGFNFDLIITLSTPDFESLGSIYDSDTEFFFKTTVVNIDHEASNDNYGQINVVNVNAVATTELLYEFFKDENIEIDADMATCLLTGLITETKSFKTANVTPTTLTLASDLVSLGGRREEIINVLYRSRQLNVLKLWGRLLSNLSSRMENRLIWSMVTAEDFIATETKPEDLADVIDELIVSLPQVQVIVLTHEIQSQDGKLEARALIHSVKNLDALYLAQPFRAEGTRHEALVILDNGLIKSSESFVASVEEKIKRLET